MIRLATCFAVGCLALMARADDPPAQAVPVKKVEQGKTTIVAPAKTDGKSTAMKSMIQLPIPKGDSPAAKSYAEIIKTANAELAMADGRDQTNAVFTSLVSKVVAQAKEYPTDEATLNALAMVTSVSSRSPDAAKERAQAIEMIKTNFAKSPLIRKQLRSLASGLDDGGAEVVRAVFQEHPELLTRAHAAKALINGLEMRERISDMLGKNSSARENYEQTFGKDAVKKLIDGAPAAKKAIEEYRTALRTDLKGLLPDLEVGAVAPESISVNLDGKTVKLSELRGKVVVLDFWATWCGPCRAMIPHTRDLVKSMAGKPFVFVSISVDDEKETLTKFLEGTPMPWTHWWDGKKALAEQWDIEGYPTIFVIDQNGVIRFKTLGYDPKSNKIDEKVEELLKSGENVK